MAITITGIRNRMGSKRVEILAYDPSGQQTEDEVLAQCLYSGELFVKALCGRYNIDYDADNEFQEEAILLYSIGEVWDYSSDEKSGKDERRQAEKLLTNYWGVSDTTAPMSESVVNTGGSVTQYTGRRTIDNTDIWLE